MDAINRTYYFPKQGYQTEMLLILTTQNPDTKIPKKTTAVLKKLIDITIL